MRHAKTIKWPHLLIWILALVGVVACTGLAGEPEVVRTLPPQPTAVPARPELFDNTVSLEQGARIFAENCVRCHGITGAGNGELVLNGQVQDVPDFTDPATIQDMSLQEWFNTITNGRLEKLMPPWKDSLNATQRWAVALYTYTMSYNQTTVTTGEATFVAQCADCHGVDGSGTEDGSSLQGQALVSFTEAGLQEALNVHQTELELSPAIPEETLPAVVSYMRLLSSQTGALADPNAVLEQPEPSTTEEANATTSDTTPVEIPESIGILTGRIIQGTEGGDSVEGLNAIIHIYDSQLREQIGEYTVGADGTYQYDEVRIRPDFAYRMTVDYKGFTYSSPVYIGDPNQTEIVLDVTIYEPGAEDSDIVITGWATQVNLSSQGLYIIQVIDLTNTSNRAYIREGVGDIQENASVGFSIPEGAQLQLEHTDPNRILLSSDGLTVLDSLAVLPNSEHYVQFSYLLPLESANNIVQPIDYTIDGPIAFFIENSHLAFTSEQMELIETRPFNNQTYNVYQVSDAPAIGDSITYGLELTSSPIAEPATNSQQAVPREALAIVLVIGGIILIASAGVVIWRNRHVVDDTIADSAMITPENLMQQIAQLDHAYEAGEIDESEYQQKRDQLKSQLMQLMKTQ